MTLNTSQNNKKDYDDTNCRQPVSQIGKPSPKNSTNLDITFIIPVYNSEIHLQDIVERLSGLDQENLSYEIILSDDGSTDGSCDLAHELASKFDHVSLIESNQNSGAGIARNAAWPSARGRYTIFFDVDDIIHCEVISAAIADMDSNDDIDVAMFAYQYERDSASEYVGMGMSDQHIFNKYLGKNTVAVDSITNMANLLGFTNYPWNKIIRTSHYKSLGIRFGKTKVNNDILGHWMILLQSRAIRLSSDILCTHIVRPGGSNLTNRFDKTRLELFKALDETYSFLSSHPEYRRRFAHHFWNFANQVVGWARPRINPDLLLSFDEKTTSFFMKMEICDFARMRTKHSSELADILVTKLIR